MSAITERDFSAYLSERGNRAGDALLTDPTASKDYISFIYGFPDSDSLPAETIAAATNDVLTNNPVWSLQYGPVNGPPAIRQALLDKLMRDQQISASLDEILVTSGSSQAIQLVVQLLVNPGDTIIAESPTFLGFFDDVVNNGAVIAAVEIDNDGMRIDQLETTLAGLRAAGKRASLIYVLPNFQNPTGVSTTLERRKRIVELAEEYDTLIVEDDAYFDLRYDGEALPSIYALDPNQRTIYLGTLSKTLAAGFRIGWAVAAAPLIRRLAALKTDGGTNIFGSYVAAAWLPEHFGRHVTELREIYRVRRDLVLAGLEKYMPEGTTWSVPEGGFFVWVQVPDGIDTATLLPQAREMGIEYLPGVACFFDDSGQNAIRLSFSFAHDDVIDEGIKRLGNLLKTELAETANS
jgi:2-aminoadipate transaminase